MLVILDVGLEWWEGSDEIGGLKGGNSAVNQCMELQTGRSLGSLSFNVNI